jgi:hypothetical protein
VVRTRVAAARFRVTKDWGRLRITVTVLSTQKLTRPARQLRFRKRAAEGRIDEL